VLYEFIILRFKISTSVILIVFPINVIFSIFELHSVYVIVVFITSLLNIFLFSLFNHKGLPMFFEIILLISISIVLYYINPLFYGLFLFGAMFDLDIVGLLTVFFCLFKNTDCMSSEGTITLLASSNGDEASQPTSPQGGESQTANSASNSGSSNTNANPINVYQALRLRELFRENEILGRQGQDIVRKMQSCNDDGKYSILSTKLALLDRQKSKVCHQIDLIRNTTESTSRNNNNRISDVVRRN
jgi:hypothetical protein